MITKDVPEGAKQLKYSGLLFVPDILIFPQVT